MEDFIYKEKERTTKKGTRIMFNYSIQGCAMIYSPFEPQPTIWPSPLDTQRVISVFWNLAYMKQTKNMFNQASYNN